MPALRSVWCGLAVATLCAPPRRPTPRRRLVVGATSPLALELAAQVTWPTPEGVSANLMTNVLTQLASIAFLALCASPAFPNSAATALMLLLMACCVLLALPVREVYRRSQAEQASRPADHSSPLLLEEAAGSGTG